MLTHSGPPRYAQVIMSETHAIAERLSPNEYVTACGRNIRPILSTVNPPVKLCDDCHAAITTPPPDKVVDLMDALNTSVENAKATRKRQAEDT